MAKGNIYLAVPKSVENNLIPEEFKDKWTITKSTEVTTTIDGEEITEIQQEVIHPTWKELGEYLKPMYGVVREFTYNEEQFLLFEVELSFVNGEIDTMLALKNAYIEERTLNNLPVNPLEYTVLNATEAKDLLAGIDIFNN